MGRKPKNNFTEDFSSEQSDSQLLPRADLTRHPSLNRTSEDFESIIHQASIARLMQLFAATGDPIADTAICLSIPIVLQSVVNTALSKSLLSAKALGFIFFLFLSSLLVAMTAYVTCFKVVR